MKHYNTTRNIKRKLRNLTRRIKAGRKSRLLFKTGDLGKNLSKMTKKVIQRGGSDNARPLVNVKPQDIGNVISAMTDPIQLEMYRDWRGVPVYKWTKNTVKNFKTAFEKSNIVGTSGNKGMFEKSNIEGTSGNKEMSKPRRPGGWLRSEADAADWSVADTSAMKG
tara:strand:+ start:262 stop:756 length:495 start_codon:yes stop_codon:yes gene_type:complete